MLLLFFVTLPDLTVKVTCIPLSFNTFSESLLNSPYGYARAIGVYPRFFSNDSALFLISFVIRTKYSSLSSSFRGFDYIPFSPFVVSPFS